MSTLRNNWNLALQGIDRYLGENRFMVFFLVLLLGVFFFAKRPKCEKAGKLLAYTVIMTAVLLCPVTAVGILIYQTGFYEYEWAWSMVPVTAVIAYGITLFLEEKFKKKLVLGLVIVAAVLFLCGNQGTLQTVSKSKKQALKEVESVLECIRKEPGEKIVWAPKDMMELVRRKDARIQLVYGRDMWDAKAGSYDYEAYNESLTGAYLWLENMVKEESKISVSPEKEELFALTWEAEEAEKGLAEYMQALADAGVNTYVLPSLTAVYVEDFLRKEADMRALTMHTASTQNYTIYFLK